MSDTKALSDSPSKQDSILLSTGSPDDEGLSTSDITSDSSAGAKIHSDSSNQPKLKSILDNPNDVLPRKPSRSGSESGFKAALKATFLPPPTPGRQIKVKDGKKLGKTFRRSEPRPNDFEGGEVLEVDPRGKHATAGDGIVPTSNLMAPPDSASESGYGSDKESSLGTPSEMGESSDFSRSFTSETSSAWGSSERGRPAHSIPSRPREGSLASTTSSSSSAAIKFAPLPVSGRLKRANSITIGVAARSHLLQSQGTAAPPRQSFTPQHVHGSQSWYNPNAHPKHDDVVDVGEVLGKGASKAWKFLRGGGNTSDDSSSKAKPAVQSQAEKTAADRAAMFDTPKKAFPKEGAPVADPETGELKMANESSQHSSSTTPHVSQGAVSDQAKKLPPTGDQTPRRAASPTAPMRSLSITEDPDAEEAAAALEAAHAENASKEAHLPNGHHPHELEDGPQHDTYHLADEHHMDSGAATPRSGMQRRLSTGAFLRGLSIRGIQEDRRRDLLGLDGDEGGERRDSGDAGAGRGIAVRTPAGKEEELGLEGYGHSRQVHS